MLAVKLLLAPGLIGLATLGARRWGPSAAGWLASLPLVAGPILLVVTLDQGTAFGARAAVAATAAQAALACFVGAYALVATAGRPWWVALPAGFAAFAAATAVLALGELPLLAAVLLSVSASQGLRLVLGPAPAALPSGRRLPADLLVRMAAGALLVLLVSAVADALGPHLTGLLTPFPSIASVLAAFTHGVDGAPAVRRYADALLRGLPSFALFTAVIALTLADWGTATAFAAGSAAALLSHALLIRRTRRSAPTGAG